MISHLVSIKIITIIIIIRNGYLKSYSEKKDWRQHKITQQGLTYDKTNQPTNYNLPRECVVFRNVESCREEAYTFSLIQVIHFYSICVFSELLSDLLPLTSSPITRLSTELNRFVGTINKVGSSDELYDPPSMTYKKWPGKVHLIKGR